MQWDVYVIYESDGTPVKGKLVHVSFRGILRGAEEEFTDDEGHATFDYDCEPGEAFIVVHDKTFGPYYIEDSNGYTIEI